MASSRKSFLSRSSYIFPEIETSFNTNSSGASEFEFDEADVWNMSYSNSNNVTESKKCVLPCLKKVSRKMESSKRVNPIGSSSLPMNIPDWSKILKDEYKKKNKESSDDDEDGDGYDGETRLPPHEYLARTRGASLSVHEGKGRTLKGRDLRSVRNAIWKKVGFED
ncbi:protein S40-4-like [Vicia villosa]|uniref:protein S40-4-like n=1 Tax=Vicia villosa TaxID=3911 RepID=UPI00273B1B9B|nr:protein S40-4-like [Vicia villosa]